MMRAGDESLLLFAFHEAITNEAVALMTSAYFCRVCLICRLRATSPRSYFSDSRQSKFTRRRALLYFTPSVTSSFPAASRRHSLARYFVTTFDI